MRMLILFLCCLIAFCRAQGEGGKTTVVAVYPEVGWRVLDQYGVGKLFKPGDTPGATFGFPEGNGVFVGGGGVLQVMGPVPQSELPESLDENTPLKSQVGAVQNADFCSYTRSVTFPVNIPDEYLYEPYRYQQEIQKIRQKFFDDNNAEFYSQSPSLTNCFSPGMPMKVTNDKGCFATIGQAEDGSAVIGISAVPYKGSVFRGALVWKFKSNDFATLGLDEPSFASLIASLAGRPTTVVNSVDEEFDFVDELIQLQVFLDRCFGVAFVSDSENQFSFGLNEDFICTEVSARFGPEDDLPEIPNQRLNWYYLENPDETESETDPVWMDGSDDIFDPTSVFARIFRKCDATSLSDNRDFYRWLGKSDSFYRHYLDVTEDSLVVLSTSFVSEGQSLFQPNKDLEEFLSSTFALNFYPRPWSLLPRNSMNVYVSFTDDSNSRVGVFVFSSLPLGPIPRPSIVDGKFEEIAADFDKWSYYEGWYIQGLNGRSRFEQGDVMEVLGVSVAEDSFDNFSDQARRAIYKATRSATLSRDTFGSGYVWRLFPLSNSREELKDRMFTYCYAGGAATVFKNADELSEDEAEEIGDDLYYDPYFGYDGPPAPGKNGGKGTDGVPNLGERSPTFPALLDFFDETLDDAADNLYDSVIDGSFIVFTALLQSFPSYNRWAENGGLAVAFVDRQDPQWQSYEEYDYSFCVPFFASDSTPDFFYDVPELSADDYDDLSNGYAISMSVPAGQTSASVVQTASGNQPRCGEAACKEIGATIRIEQVAEGAIVQGCLGLQLLSDDCRILDDTCRDLDPDADGQLVLTKELGYVHSFSNPCIVLSIFESGVPGDVASRRASVFDVLIDKNEDLANAFFGVSTSDGIQAREVQSATGTVRITTSDGSPLVVDRVDAGGVQSRKRLLTKFSFRDMFPLVKSSCIN